MPFSKKAALVHGRGARTPLEAPPGTISASCPWAPSHSRDELPRPSKVSDEGVSSQAEYEMRDRPLVAGLQDLAANHLVLRRSRAGVVSDKEKARMTRQVRVGKTSASEPLMKRRNIWVTSKPRHEDGLGMSAGDTCLLPAWHPALRWRESDLGLYLELENLSSRCQGRSSSGSPTRARVPMRDTGAEWPVVARKAA
jgi:hypothetical protein